MAGYTDIASGRSVVIKLKCAKGNDCLLERAIEVRERYVRSLMTLEYLNKKYGNRLQMAKFASEVVKKTAESPQLKKEVWKNMRTSKQGGEATSYEDTWLKKDILRIETKIKAAKKRIERAAKAHTYYISKPVFHQHLMKYHKKALSHDAVKAAYGITLPQTSDKNRPDYRECDHYLAVLTDGLAATDAGAKFLNQLTDDNWLQKRIGFSDIWGYLGKFNATTEPIGKFINNWSPAITMRVQKIINDGKAKNVKDVLADPDIKRHLGFWKKRMKIDVEEWLQKKASIYEKGAAKAARRIQFRAEFKLSAKEWMTEGHKNFDAEFTDKIKQHEHKAKLDSLWIGVTLDLVAFALSAIKIVSDLKASKGKDWAAAANDLLGFSKTLVEGRQSYLSLRGKGFEKQAKLAGRLAKGLTVVAGIMAAVLHAWEIVDGIKSKDWDVVALNAAGLLISVGGTVSALYFSALTGVFIVLGIILAIIMSLVLDAKIIDYIEDLHWGEDGVTPIKDTMNKYYEMFSLYALWKLDKFDANKSCLMVECALLNKSKPVFVEVLQEEPKIRSMGSYRVYPGLTRVRGRGRVKRYGPWKKPFANLQKEIRIFNMWDIWTGIKRDDKTEYTIRVGMDPDDSARKTIAKMALNKEVTGVEFPLIQEPQLYWARDIPQILRASQWNNVRKYLSRDWYFPYPKNGKISVNIFTKYGADFKADVKLSASIDQFVDRKLVPVSKSVSKRKLKYGFEKTTLSIDVPAPSDKYELDVSWELLSTDNKKVYAKQDMTIYVATKSYMAGLR